MSNDRDNALSITGTGFAEGVTLALGGEVLTNIKVQSSTMLSVTMPSGLCPGVYAPTLMAPDGQIVAGGGTLEVRGHRTVSMGATGLAPQPLNIRLNGQDQRLTVALAPIVVDDTTCSVEDVHMTVTVADFTQVGRTRGQLAPQVITLTAPGALQTAPARFTRTTGDAQVLLTVPASGRPGISTFTPMIEVVVPANAYAGRYATTVAAAVTNGF